MCARPTTATACCKDVHWYAGSIGGAFQCYTLGNIIGAQLYESALRDLPDIPEQIASGDTSSLLEWMTTNVYRVGSASDAGSVDRANLRRAAVTRSRCCGG